MLVEGFKHEEIPKIELHRKEMERPFIYPKDSRIIAIVVEEGLTLEDADHLIRLDINQPQQVADFIAKEFIK